MGELSRRVQNEVVQCLLFVDEIILFNESREGLIFIVKWQREVLVS